MRRWPNCTESTAPPSPQQSARSGPCSRPAASPSPTAPACASALWQTCSPTPTPRASRLRLDGTETQVRRPQAHRPGRRAFVSGKRKQNTIKTTGFSDHQGRLLFAGVIRPGRMHDQTCIRTEGIAEQLRHYPNVRAEVDEGYRGLANEFPTQISAPPKSPRPTPR